jgi:hypothetical protein
MAGRDDEFYEFDEVPDEYLEDENPEKLIDGDPERPKVGWLKDIERIEDQEIREKEIGIADKLNQQEKELDDRLESGEITEYQHWAEYEFGIRKEKIKAATRCALESVGLNYDKLGALSDEVNIIATGDPDLIEKVERLDKMINLRGPEASQELADQMLEEERLSEDTHEFISRRIKSHGK